MEKTIDIFCLRFGAIAITPGTTVRRHKFHASSDYRCLRLNCSMDACNLSSNERGCMTDIIQPLAGDEYVLDTFSVDALNECRDTWHLSLACDKHALNRSSLHSFCGDRLKGQDAVNANVYPQLDFTKCHFQIKENILQVNGGAKFDQHVFVDIAYTLTGELRKRKILKYNRSQRPTKMKDYFKQSLMPEEDKWAGYGMNGNKDGIFTCQPSESFHHITNQNKIRLSPMPFVHEGIIKYEHDKVHRLRSKYERLLQSGIIFPGLLHDIIVKRTQRAENVEIEPTQSGRLCAKVTSRYENMRYTHIINLSVHPPTCSYGCLRLLGIPCKEMCSYAQSVCVNIESIIPYKFTVQGW